MIGLRRIVRFLRLAERAAGTGCGLSAAQLFVLRVLVDSPARSIAEIAARTLTDQSSVSTVVARLVDKKLVRRKMVTTDRRRAALVLTTAGHRIATSLSRLPQVAIVEAVRAMPEARQANLVRTLSELMAAIGADAVSPKMLFEDESSSRKPSRR
ncbi:hypothetical protein BH11MYX1_BH11MYX1_29040 [soil metagenome]